MAEYRGLDALALAEDLAVECRKVADDFPPREHELADQLRRAATCAALNLAEGAARTSLRDQRRFLDTCRSSLKEVETILRIAMRSGIVTEDRYREVDRLRDRTAAAVFGLIRSVTARIERGATRRAPL